MARSFAMNRLAAALPLTRRAGFELRADRRDADFAERRRAVVAPDRALEEPEARFFRRLVPPARKLIDPGDMGGSGWPTYVLIHASRRFHGWRALQFDQRVDIGVPGLAVLRLGIAAETMPQAPELSPRAGAKEVDSLLALIDPRLERGAALGGRRLAQLRDR